MHWFLAVLIIAYARKRFDLTFASDWMEWPMGNTVPEVEFLARVE